MLVDIALGNWLHLDRHAVGAFIATLIDRKLKTASLYLDTSRLLLSDRPFAIPTEHVLAVDPANPARNSISVRRGYVALAVMMFGLSLLKKPRSRSSPPGTSLLRSKFDSLPERVLRRR